MKYELLDVVVLDREMPEHGLRSGDLGTVVELYPPHGLEVEFVSGSGKARALLTLADADVRLADDDDLLAVRPFDRPS